MKRMIGMLALLAGCARGGGFELATPERVAPIVVAEGEPECVRLAAEDLASDVAKITGRRPDVLAGGALPQGGCVVVGTASNPEAARLFAALGQTAEVAALNGQWEAYRAASLPDGRLAIAGADARGTLFGVYAFIEAYLKVDPLGFWSGREPDKRAALRWDAVALASGPPAFKYRGWFINDEDLLTFWLPEGGTRTLEYKFYSNMMRREALRAVAEALVRSRCNLVIPASFIDILNPPEEALVQECARRGLFLSMHHQEPLGVSAWTYFNYWKARGRDLKYSYVSHPAEVREVWRAYAEKWAAYPNVIWQLGLRGKGDRPMWQADPDTPQSDADRGRIISEAMAAQVRILDEVCPRRGRVMSTTLWAEGAVLNQKGLLAIPPDTIVVFADNSPGWKWQQDFYSTPRDPRHRYGVYYHHALIGSGPHLAQAVPPHKTFALLQEALRRDAGEYAIFNVANVREFVLGIDATAKMTWRMDGFDPDAWLDAWAAERFPARRHQAADAYRIYFNAYQIHDVQRVPFLLDGQILGKGLETLKRIADRLKAGTPGAGASPEKFGPAPAADRLPPPDDAFWAALSDAHPRALEPRETLKRAAAQRAGFDLAALHARAAESGLPPAEAAFFRDNLVYPAELMSRLSAWLERALLASEALDAGDIPACVAALEAAESALAQTGPLGEAYCHGQWKEWYRGCVILDLPARLRRTRDVLELARARLR